MRRVLIVCKEDKVIGAYTSMKSLAFYVPGINYSSLKASSAERGFPLKYKGYVIYRGEVNCPAG